ncbi:MULTISPECIES: zinc-binding dehydrogenase [unclassified Streptomyces]|uniref:zinc-binding dehydrogenase n=1 Tax=unclassified Streptomyces TaxID=2593676 RepID=UPI00336A4E7E
MRTRVDAIGLNRAEIMYRDGAYFYQPVFPDYVLITAASSSVGLAAIQIPGHVGGIPIATTRGPGKKQRPLDAGAADVIVTDEEDPPARTKEITGGEGVRLAFDPIAGPGVETLAQGIAPGGFLVVNAGLASGSFAPVVDRTFDLTEIAEAHRYLEANGQVGKIVVTVSHDAA